MAKRKTGRASKVPKLVRQDGDLCLTFINTASDKRKGLETFADLLAWGKQNHILRTVDAQRLERTAAERSDDADAVVRQVEELRARLERIVLALAEGVAPDDADLEAFNSGLGAALSNRRVVLRGGEYRLRWGDRGGDDLDRVLWPVYLYAAEFISAGDFRRLRQCAGEDCDLLFIDRSRGSPRKWCDSKTCGHRSRSLKHYHLRVKPKRQARAEAFQAAELKDHQRRMQAALDRKAKSDPEETPS